ncbi:MAG: 23S rRNA (adenine(2503)-C(2))-methyltransferase RlmN [candidate division WOR-3 bacterium]|nr:23S rRNA (adenine(2503)-C(2))-methyltransferase RlmN [candidate division WOR-3 bacterium]
MENIKSFTIKELKELTKKLNWEEYNAYQIFQWLWQKKINDFSLMTNLSKLKREYLKKNFIIGELKILGNKKAKDGTEKFLFELSDNNKIEAVFIPEEKRRTICVSSQVGCPLKCLLCNSGKIPFKRNLYFYEICDQILMIEKTLNIKATNIVFMGIGEPLLNLEEVLKAIQVINSPIGFNISARKITISTAGIVEGIYRLAEIRKKIKLAISLNATKEEIREYLMPINKKYPISEILKACEYYWQKKKERITFEYVLIKDINDSEEDAHRLKKMLRRIPCKINLIPFNPFPGVSFQPPSLKRIENFMKILSEANYTVILRKSRGKEILAGCGQLACQNYLF